MTSIRIRRGYPPRYALRGLPRRSASTTMRPEGHRRRHVRYLLSVEVACGARHVQLVVCSTPHAPRGCAGRIRLGGPVQYLFLAAIVVGAVVYAVDLVRQRRAMRRALDVPT